MLFPVFHIFNLSDISLKEKFNKINIFNSYKRNSIFFKCLIYFLSNNSNKIREKKNFGILHDIKDVHEIDNSYSNIYEIKNKQNIEILQRMSGLN